MQPEANRRRALAMSVRGVSTFTPTASIDTTSDSTERQQQIEVVNHQVEDHVDVEAALRKRAEPVNFDEPRVATRAAAPPPPPGLNRSVWPAASTTPRRAAASISRSASASD